MARRITRLIFVYDASTDAFGAIADSLKKLVGKGCPLCAITHGVAGPRPEWHEAVERLGVPIDYQHGTQSSQMAPTLPCVLAEVEGETECRLLLDADAIGRSRGTPADLEGRLKFRAAALDLVLPHHGAPNPRVSGPPPTPPTTSGLRSASRSSSGTMRTNPRFFLSLAQR